MNVEIGNEAAQFHFSGIYALNFRYSVGHCKPFSKVMQSGITEHWTMGRWTAINKLDSCIIILSERWGVGGRGRGAMQSEYIVTCVH